MQFGYDSWEGEIGVKSFVENLSIIICFNIADIVVVNFLPEMSRAIVKKH